MPWKCTGFDDSYFSDIGQALAHQRAFPTHVVEEQPEQERVGMSDFGTVTLRGPDGRVKQVVGLN